MIRRLALLVVLLMILASCGDDGAGDADTGTASSRPPNSVEELAEIFDPQLEPMGLHITRGGLYDRSDGGYVLSDDGGHLALYVEPLDDADYDTADYVEGLGTVTALVTPEVFERWSGVDSYDICQEPPADIDDTDAPAPYTQIELDRATAESVDWDDANAATVIALGLSADTRLIVTQVIRDHPAYVEAEAASLE